MPYFVRKEDFFEVETPLGIVLLVELWMNVLQSRTSMLLGPSPISTLSLLESIRHSLDKRLLKLNTIKIQIGTALKIIQQRAWIRMTYPRWSVLETKLIDLYNMKHPNSVDEVVSCLDELLYYFSSTRVLSHLDFIFRLNQSQLPLIKDEITDFISDLIAIGHSESFLYSWGQEVFFSESVCSLTDRLQLFHNLSQKKKFTVWFKIRSRNYLPNTDSINIIGKKVPFNFSKLTSWVYNSDEKGVLVKVDALDYKVAIELAIDKFNQYIDNLTFNSRLQRVILITEEFRIKNENDGDELIVPTADVKPYEPPLLTCGNAAWICQGASPKIVPVLERTLQWLANSRKLSGEARLIALWFALVSLFTTDNVKTIIPWLARYQLLSHVQVLADWIVDYLGKAHYQGWTAISSKIRDRLKLRSKIEGRLAPLVQTVRIDFNLLEPLINNSPLLFLRLTELQNLCCESQRSSIVSKVEGDLQTLLPWVECVRHSIAHLGYSTTSLDLANQYLGEYVSLVYDQVVTTALSKKPEPISIKGIHMNTMNDFDTMMESILVEPCVSILHVRQGLNHENPYRRNKPLRKKY